jgi:hypothetical protein
VRIDLIAQRTQLRRLGCTAIGALASFRDAGLLGREQREVERTPGKQQEIPPEGQVGELAQAIVFADLGGDGDRGGLARCTGGLGVRPAARSIRAIFSFQTSGAPACGRCCPSLSTATVTGMSSTVNS